MKNDEYKFKEETFVTVPAFKETGIPERCFVVQRGTDKNGRRACFLMPMGLVSIVGCGTVTIMMLLRMVWRGA